MKIVSNKIFIRCTLYFILCAQISFSQNYFQQEVKYTIHVSLNDVKHELSAYETIVYINHSPNELKEIYFHLWPNAYKNNETALANQYYAKGDRRMLDADEKNLGFIDSLDFTVDGETIQWKYDSLYIDVCKLTLNHPLKSGDSISIATPFRVKIPWAGISRMGHIWQAYYISQWFPKPSVYDRYGWHPIPYLDQGEFYSEFGSFDVSITLPKNYVVGATGDLQTEEEKTFLEKKIEETKNISSFGKNMDMPNSDAETKTIRFIQSNVHDFAWFADKRYHVLKGEVELPASKRKVNTWIMFTNNEANLWKDALEYLNNATYYYSLWTGDYPYNNISAVDGTISAGGGMEYPNITVIGECGTARLLELTIAHEAGHNWFYGILGSNERENPWMDEGMNQFCELRYSETVKRKNESLIELGTVGKIFGIDTLTDKTIDEFGYLISARSNSDQPLNLHSEKFSTINYGTCVYYKTALSFNYLKAYLGDTLFDRCMKAYYEKWKFKHPYPADVRAVFEETSQKNLSWFFDDLLGTTKKIDYKVVSLKDGITIKNKGGIAGPVSISAIKDGAVIFKLWTEGFTGTKKISLATSDFDKLMIDADRSIPEINRKNNSIRTSGIFKKWDKLNFKFLGGFEKPSVTQVFYLPVLGWNNYDKVMAGLALHNIFAPEKKFEYFLMPMYSTRTNTFTGGGNILYNFYPGTKTGKERWVRKMTLELGGQSYHYADFTNTTIDHKVTEQETFRFSKLVPALTLHFNPAEKNSGIESSLALKVSQIKYESIFYQSCTTCLLAGDSSEFFYRIDKEENYFPEAVYFVENRSAIDPYSASVGISYTTRDKITRIFAEGNYRFSYKGRNRGFDVRIFAGAITKSSGQTVFPDYRLQMSGYNGVHDYMFDHVFLGRTEPEGILSKQFVAADGGFKAPTATGQSGSWLMALNLKTSIPGRLPIRLYADLGLYDTEYAGPNQTLMYDYGFELAIIPNVFSIYIPIGLSQDIQNYYDAQPEDRYGNWYNRIRYEIRFEKLNPLKLIRSIQF